MTVQTKTTIGFAIPEEYDAAVYFEKQNRDFIKHDTSSYIYFVKDDFYIVKTKDAAN